MQIHLTLPSELSPYYRYISVHAHIALVISNVSGAQRELLKYYASISGNRALMLKIFGILIIFFLVFTLVT